MRALASLGASYALGAGVAAAGWVDERDPLHVSALLLLALLVTAAAARFIRGGA